MGTRARGTGGSRGWPRAGRLDALARGRAAGALLNPMRIGGLGPVDLLGELARSKVDQAAAAHLAVLAANESEPVNGALGGVDDQDLVDVVGGVERQLLPAPVLLARRSRRRGLQSDATFPLHPHDAGRRRAPGSLPVSGRG